MTRLSAAEIKQLLEALEASAWDEATITVEDVTISVARNGASLSGSVLPPAPSPVIAVTAPTPSAVAAVTASTPVSTVAPSAAPPGSVVVTAPSVGVVWWSPQPGSPPFVEVGAWVERGDTLCIIEIMKLMNNIAAEVAGTVVAIHVENSTQVEFGTPLITIAPG